MPPPQGPHTHRGRQVIEPTVTAAARTAPPAPAPEAEQTRRPSANSRSANSRSATARSATARTTTERAGSLLAVLLPGLLALTLGLWGLTRRGAMWRDESVTYQVAHRSLSELWGLLGGFDAVHGLYYVLMHGVFAVWDGGLSALRMPSVLATVVSAVCVTLIGRRLGGPRTGLLAGLLFALLPAVQMYAQEGRSYALVCACVASATLLLVRALDRHRSSTWVAYTAVALLACLLHEFAYLAVLAHGVALFAGGAPRAARRAWIGSAVVVAAGVAPLAVFSLGQSAQVSWISGPGWTEWLVMGLVGLVGLGCARIDVPGARPLSARALALPLLILPTAALLLLSLHEPVFLERYVLHYTVALALLLGVALDRGLTKVPRTAFAACGAALLALLPVTLQLRTPDSRKDDVTAIAHAVQRLSSPKDGVLFMPSRRREWAMSYPDQYAGLRDLALSEDPARSRTLQGTERGPSAIRAAMMAGPRIVALRDPAGQPLDPYAFEKVKRATLRAHFVECRTVQVHGARVTLYARPGHCDG